jgi:hypothetical protein
MLRLIETENFRGKGARPSWLRSIQVENFRALERFWMDGLGRVNLLVGGNNCGKTSLLEAIHLFSAVGDLETVGSILERRGEVLEEKYDAGILHLFPGHKVKDELTISIKGQTDSGDLCDFSIRVERKDAPIVLFSWRPTGQESRKVSSKTEISRQGGVSRHELMRLSMFKDASPPVQFISTVSLSAQEVSPMFEKVVLSPEEDRLIEALRTIEPGIERIASVGKIGAGARAGLFVKLAGTRERVPIGSLGEGMWRLLVLALGLVQARGGVLLVDDIDTGLHYSVMADMWRLVQRTAERLDVQVFATTHSRDCYESLATIARPDVSTGSEVSIQRIERERAVAFTEQEIVIAARRGIEVR